MSIHSNSLSQEQCSRKASMLHNICSNHCLDIINFKLTRSNYEGSADLKCKDSGYSSSLARNIKKIHGSCTENIYSKEAILDSYSSVSKIISVPMFAEVNKICCTGYVQTKNNIALLEALVKGTPIEVSLYSTSGKLVSRTVDYRCDQKLIITVDTPNLIIIDINLYEVYLRNEIFNMYRDKSSSFIAKIKIPVSNIYGSHHFEEMIHHFNKHVCSGCKCRNCKNYKYCDEKPCTDLFVDPSDIIYDISTVENLKFNNDAIECPTYMHGGVYDE